MLHSLGFTDHEARVYVTLLDHPPLKASMLAKLAQIPRNRVYEIVQALQARGLVEIKLGATRTYLAKSLSVFLDRKIEDLQARARELSDNREQYSAAFQPTAPEDAADLDVGTTRVLSGRRAVAREIDRMLRSAKKRVIAVASVGGAERLLSYIEVAGLGANVRRTQPRLTIYVSNSVAASASLGNYLTLFGKSLHGLELDVSALSLIVDGRELLLSQPIPDDESPSAGRDFAILTTNSAIIEDHAKLIEAAGGPPIAEGSARV